MNLSIFIYFIYHSYHHTFPYDYSTAEMGEKLNVTKMFIDLMAYFGAAYDLKTATKNSISNRREKNLAHC